MSFQLPTAINPAAMATLAEHLKGKRLEHLQNSVAGIDASLAAGGWLPKACQRSTKGFGQGFPAPVGRCRYDSPVSNAQSAISYGSNPGTWEAMVAGGATEEELQALSPKQALVAIQAWLTVCHEASVARTLLTVMRPLPKVTEIGLSPKVTTTLTDMGLDIDLPSIVPTKIGCTWHHGIYPRTREVTRYDSDRRRNVTTTEPHPKGGELMYDHKREPVMLPRYFLDWTPGTLFGLSRYAHHDCEACGKTIPSGEFVAVEADCKANGHVGLYFGRDCASNIFGVKDAGMPKDAK
jgi:hypothetical protein